jgi:hypothetical protein
MWRSVGEDKIKKMEGKKIDDEPTSKKRRGYLRVDCQSASKGLFLGLLCLVGGIIILIIFFVMKDSPEYKDQMFWIYSGAEIVILSLSILSSLFAFVQVQKLSHSFNVPYDLDTLLSSITITGSYIYGVFGMLAALFSLPETESLVVFVHCGLLVLQVTMQGKNDGLSVCLLLGGGAICSLQSL